jgi:hypothetical protein
MMSPRAWQYLALSPFGPLVGWLFHNAYYPDEMGFFGAAVFIAWSGFCLAGMLANINWDDNTTMTPSNYRSPSPLPPPYPGDET